MLIEMTDFYDVDIRELIDGERKSEKMNKDMEETVLKVADYSNEEKNRLMKKLHYFSWAGVITFIVFLVLDAMDLSLIHISRSTTSRYSALRRKTADMGQRHSTPPRVEPRRATRTQKL